MWVNEMWKMKATILPVVLGALGVIKKGMRSNVEKLLSLTARPCGGPEMSGVKNLDMVHPIGWIGALDL